MAKAEIKQLVERYTYRVTWSEEAGEYVAYCAEFPGLQWLAPSPESAIGGIRRLVGRTVLEMSATGQLMPQALSAKNFSGKFMVRVPPETHRRLAVLAAESGVSLNRLVTSKLGMS